MEEIVTCSICTKVFDSLHLIPKMIECGHTFCSPCLTKLFQKNARCPNCNAGRTEIKGTESSLPTNYIALKAVDVYKSKASSKKEIITSIENMKKKCMKRKEIISEKKTRMTSSLEVLDKCLAQLEELTVSDTHKDDTENVREILHEMDEDLKKTDDVVRCVDAKSSVSIFLSSFGDPKAYLREIYKRVQNIEKVFTVCKIEDEIKYGKVSMYENKLFFHSLSLSEVPTDSSLIRFEELKECANIKNFYTFLEICCNKNNLPRMIIIKMLDKQISNYFIRLCTGENGPSYKGASFKRVDNVCEFKFNLNVENFMKNGRRCKGMIDYNLCFETGGFSECDFDEMFVHVNYEVFLSLFLCSKTAGTSPCTFGKLISPRRLGECINYDDASFLKILDCGIILEL